MILNLDTILSYLLKIFQGFKIYATENNF
ncbi:DUF764 family protein, partial [Borreliella garinii]